MGSYTFQWEHPAEEVFVTGTFDDWGKTVKLEKDAEGVFKKTVELPHSGENVYYKFVKDGEWVTSHTAPTETDSSGNTNNVLTPSDIKPSNHTTSSAAPLASTAALAGAVPKTGSTEEASKDTPGAFPETPAATSTEEPKDVSVNPIPASDGPGNPVDLKPGEKVPDPSTINSNSLTSGVHDDPELKAADEARQKEGEQSFGVAPIPASSGLGNPIDLKPGEKVPESSEINSNTVNSTVKTDKESYEKSDAYPTEATGGDQSKQLDAAGGAFSVPPVTNNMIPESSIPSGQGSSAKDADPGVTVQSAAPESSTAALAGQVPLEPSSRRNIDEYKPDPFAKASGAGAGVAAGAVGGAALGGAAINSAAPESSTAALAGQVPKEDISDTGASAVPEEVKESQKEAGFAPEASANPEAVSEKAAVEKELLKEVKPDNSAGEPAPTETAATTTTAPSSDAPSTTPATAATGAGAGAAAAGATGATSTAKDIRQSEQEAHDRKQKDIESGEIVLGGAAAAAAGGAAVAAATSSSKEKGSTTADSGLKAPAETTTSGPSATTGIASEKVPEKSLPETPKKGGNKDGVSRRMSGAFKKVMGEGSSSSPAQDTPSSTKTGKTTDTTTTSGTVGSTGTAGKGHKKRQSIFKKIKEAFKGDK